jgi:transcriptional regulator with XRE-family HTH domain
MVAPASTTASLPPNQTVGARVKWLLEQRGWSLMRLHHRSGVSHSALSLLVRGKVAYPSVRTIEMIARAFDVPRTYLMPQAADGPDPPGDPPPEGVHLVPVVLLWATPAGHQATGEQVPVPLSVPGNHATLLATRINGGGLPPYVAIGSVAIFDPDRSPCHRDPVVIDYNGSTHAAWYLEHQIGDALTFSYRLGDGTMLGHTDIRLAGVLVAAQVTPPRYPGSI